MSDLYRITGGPFREKLQGRELSEIDSTKRPQLHWIAISALRVDSRYQRRIEGRTSERNVVEIAVAFDWSKFAPVVVAELEDEEGAFAVIDGQHRTTAAHLRGIKDIPCLVHQVDLTGQASAFAAINGIVTTMSTMQLHAARVAAGDPDAVALHEACADAGVKICRYPVPASLMKPGETLAAAKLAQQLQRYGRDILVAALSCITKTGDGNVGFVRAPVVEALCATLNGEPAWAEDLSALIEAMQVFEFQAAWSTARLQASQQRVGIASPLVDIISEHLERILAKAA